MDFKNAIFTEKKVVIQEDHVFMKWDNGVVYEYGMKSKDTIKREQKQAEKQAKKEELENDLDYQMNLAIEKIEERRIAYRNKDLEDYGYDNYTKDFYYEPPEEEEC
jgi:hypothetical protein